MVGPLAQPDVGRSVDGLGSLGLVPLSGCPFCSASDSGSDTTLTGDQGYLTSDTVSTASTDSGYASTETLPPLKPHNPL